MTIFTQFPYLAIPIGVLYFWIYQKAKLKIALLTGWCWCFYAVYEALMHFRILCSGECNIRVDLLVLYPVMIFLSFITMLFYIKSRAPKAQE